MKKNTLLFCLILCVCSCKEDAPTSLPGNEYVNEYMSTEPGMSGEEDSFEYERYLRPWLSVYEGYYTVSEEYVKTKHNLRSSIQIYQTLSFGKSDCSIRDFRDIKEHVSYSNDLMTTYKFKEGSFSKSQYNPFLDKELHFIFYVRADGLYNQVVNPDEDNKESKLFPFKEDFQCKYLSQKGTISDSEYEDLTYTTDNTETFTYTQTGNEILMVNEERQIKGVVSSDYKTISLTQISPNTQEIGTFNYK